MIIRKPAPPTPTETALFTQRFTLYDVSVAEYEGILRAIGDRRLRHTFCQGKLELMAPSPFHESVKKLLGRMIETISLERDVPLHPLGSATFHPPGADRGLEPDEVYFVANEPAMRGRRDYDPDRDPPPDLTVEVDVASSSLGRLEVYAAWGVSEVWLHDGQALTFLRRQSRRPVYEPTERSLAFPWLAPAEVQRFLDIAAEQGHHAAVRQFVAWLRESENAPAPPSRARRKRKADR
jgi:Uma2 family endonuclease